MASLVGGIRLVVHFTVFCERDFPAAGPPIWDSSTRPQSTLSSVPNRESHLDLNRELFVCVPARPAQNGRPRACHQISQMRAAAKWMAARKLSAVLS